MNNKFSPDHLGAKQKRLIQLILDNGGELPENFVISYVERKTLESLMPKGFTRIRNGRWLVPKEKWEQLQFVYGMKVHV